MLLVERHLFTHYSPALRQGLVVHCFYHLFFSQNIVGFGMSRSLTVVFKAKSLPLLLYMAGKLLSSLDHPLNCSIFYCCCCVFLQWVKNLDCRQTSSAPRLFRYAALPL